MNLKVSYSTIIIKNTEESVSFYRDVLGFEFDSDYHIKPGTLITLMRSKKGDTMMELIETNDGENVGFYSVGMEVEDMETTIKELKSKGAKILMEPVPTMVGSCGFIEDPNGVRIALVQHK